MTDFEFKCPKCMQQIVTDEAYVGENIACPGCGEEIQVPKPVQEEAPSSKGVAAPASDSVVWRSPALKANR